MDRKGELRHVPEGGGRNFGQEPEGGTAIVACERCTTKSGYFTIDPGGMSTINWSILYQDSESNKYFIGKTNKITMSILEFPQETCPDNFQVKVP